VNGMIAGMTPYTIDVPDEVLDDLRSRLARTRWPAEVEGVGWSRGTDPSYLRDLVAYWADGFDWRTQEAELNTLPHFKADALHFVHQRSADDGALPLLLVHGWPDSFLRFRRVLPLLTGFHLVVPSLPGYGFSAAPTEPGHATRGAMAERLAGLMAALGYERYAVSGGDIGSATVETLAAAHPDRVVGLHLTDVPLWHLTGVDPASVTAAERDYLATAADWQRREGAYLQLQSTKPATAAYGLTDSPAGLAAWIVEKLRSWSDDFAAAFPPDELLTHLTLYWVTNTIGSSFGPYVEREATAPHGRVPVPAAISQFPADTLHAPRSYAERFLDVRQWREHTRGGHFAALEAPDLFATDLHDFLTTL
jgi:pimeloyl-ACP methyl ester carboxylesterase